MDRVLTFIRGTEGASAAEYALILAVIGTAVAGGMILLGNSISTAVTSTAACISSGTKPAC